MHGGGGGVCVYVCLAIVVWHRGAWLQCPAVGQWQDSSQLHVSAHLRGPSWWCTCMCAIVWILNVPQRPMC
jgi:hypothetical protein